MDVFTIARACLRRWYVFVPLLVIAAVLAVFQGRSVKPEYSATSSVIVVAPSLTAQNTSADDPLPVNPLGSVSTAQLALVERLNTVQTAQQVARTSGATGGFGATADTKGPVISITAGASTAEATRTTLQAAVAQVPSVLKALQADLKVPSKTYFRVVTLTPYQGVGADYPHRSRNIVLVALAGFVVSLIIAQLADSLLLANAARRGRRRGGATGTRGFEDESPHEQPFPFSAESDRQTQER